MFSTHPIELVWFSVSLLSLLLSAATLRDAIVDATFLLASGKNGARKVIADLNIRQEGFRMAITVIMVLASGLSLFLDPPPPDYTQLPQSLVTMAAWIVVAFIMAIWSLLDTSARRKLAAYSVAVNPTDPVTGAAVDPSQPVDEAPPKVDRRIKSGTAADRKAPPGINDTPRQTDHRPDPAP